MALPPVLTTALADSVVFFRRYLQPHTTPFNFITAALIGAITAGFLVLTLLMILVATNFNLLGAIE